MIAAGFRLTALLAAGLALVACGGEVAHEPPLVIANTTLIDGTGAAAREGVTLVIRDGRLTDVAPADDINSPAGATV
ncbi:MAG TPA: hypothetical protein VFG84_04085, partial [Gemmatimonadaceae bacterium]|nr:hypothetical protein [Gemmatimonadaceae bacterium]